LPVLGGNRRFPQKTYPQVSKNAPIFAFEGSFISFPLFMKFYCQDTAFLIVPRADSPIDPSYMVFINADIDLVMFYYRLVSQEMMSGVPGFAFVTTHYQALTEELERHFTPITAAGGLVVQQGKVLFIYRLDRWDLPKGKVEKGESVEMAALREVEEECGISVKLVKKVGITQHSYTMYGITFMKTTHWFAMDSHDGSTPTPQLEEGIEEVRWVDVSTELKAILQNTFPSIREICHQYFEGH
jgi:8-oxo-dGTP pyrophosphatase MutT (NUDIX family)